MEFILYGASGSNYYPEVGFTKDGDGSTQLEFEGNHVLRVDDLDDKSTITWRDLARWGIDERRQEELFGGGPDSPKPGTPYVFLLSDDVIRETHEEEVDHLALFRAVIKHLSELVDSEPERKFLHLYAKRCAGKARNDGIAERIENDSLGDENPGIDPVELWNHTALIPQVWVNKIAGGSSRSERSDVEPFRIDFLLKPPESVSPNFSIVQIDGIGHVARSELDAADNRQYQPSLKMFTEHTKKDRWLRKHGYDVVRFTTKEVREMADVERGAKQVRDRLFYTLRKMSGAWS